jgi:hypothetical protein
MCNSGTPLRRVAACTCWRPGALIAAATLALGVVAGIWASVPLVLATGGAAAGGIVAFAVFMNWRLGTGGLWLIRRTQPVTLPVEEPAQEPAPPLPWYERAQLHSHTSHTPHRDTRSAGHGQGVR